MIRKAAHFSRRIGHGLSSRWRNVWLRLLGVRIDGYAWIRPIEVPRNHRNIHLDRCSLDAGVVLLCLGDDSPGIRLSVGRGSYLNRSTFVDALESVVIGSDVAIGPGCYITDHDHGCDPGKTPLGQPMVAAPTRIGDRVWLGAGVIVLKGVEIGDGTIVGAGSVVTKSLPPSVIAVGVPAKVVRQRLPGVDVKAIAAAQL
jgi:acetyltransferase-like isoleucine patch superfamily enzyme